MGQVRLPKLAGIAFCIVLCLAHAARAAEVVYSDHRLPKDTLGYITVRNVPEFKAQWQKTVFGQLTKEEALSDFWKDVSAQISKASQKVEEELGLSLSDLLEVPQGELTFALVHPEGDKTLSIVALMDFGTKDDSIKKILEQASAALEKNGAKRSEEEFEETRLTIYQGQKAEADEEDEDEKKKEGAAPPTSTVYFMRDSYVVVGSSAAAVKLIVSHWDGKHAHSLIENEYYRHIIERCSDENQETKPLVAWFFDPIGLVKSAMSSSKAGLNQWTQFMGLMPMLGLNKLKGIGGTMDLATSSYDTISRIMIYLEPPATGVFNMLQFPSIGQEPPKWVSARVDSYFSANWNVEKAFSALESIVDGVQGAGFFSKTMEAVAASPQAGGLHLKKDLLDHLTGKLHVVGYPSEAESDPTDRFVFAAELSNPGSLKTTLGKVAKLPGFPGKVRQFEGETLYEIPVKGAEDEEEDEEDKDRKQDKNAAKKPSSLGISIARNQLIIASDVQLLEQVLRGLGDEEPLAESADYRKFAAKFPAKTSWISFQRDDAQLKAAYEMLRTGKLAAALDADISATFSKLPAFDAVKKYLTPSGTYMQPEDRGMLIVNFKLRNDANEK